MPDFGRSGGDCDIGEAGGRHNHAATGNHRDVADTLGFCRIIADTLERQVEALVADGNLGNPQPVIEGINGGAEITGIQAIIRQPDLVRNQPDFRCTQFETGTRAQLVAFFARHQACDLIGGILGNPQDIAEIGAGNVQINRPATTDAAPEQRGLGDKAISAGFFKNRGADGRDQIPDTSGILLDG